MGFYAFVLSEISINYESGTVFQKTRDATFFSDTKAVDLSIVITSPDGWLKRIKNQLFEFKVNFKNISALKNSKKIYSKSYIF